jgi:hypothetical protein
MEPGRALKFPGDSLQGGVCDVTVDVLAVVGRGKLQLNPYTNKYGLEIVSTLSDSNMSCEVEVSWSKDHKVAMKQSDLKTVSANGRSGRQTHRHSHAISVQNYMSEHRLLEAMHSALQAAVKDWPEDPVMHMSKKLKQISEQIQAQPSRKRSKGKKEEGSRLGDNHKPLSTSMSKPISEKKLTGKSEVDTIQRCSSRQSNVRNDQALPDDLGIPAPTRVHSLSQGGTQQLSHNEGLSKMHESAVTRDSMAPPEPFQKSSSTATGDQVLLEDDDFGSDLACRNLAEQGIKQLIPPADIEVVDGMRRHLVTEIEEKVQNQELDKLVQKIFSTAPY